MPNKRTLITARARLKKAGFAEREVRRGTRFDPDADKGRLYGGIYTRGSLSVYFTFRKTCDIFRNGEETIAEAIQKGRAAWAIDLRHLHRFDNDGVGYAGIFNQTTNEFWMTPIADWFDNDLVEFRNYERRGGAPQHYMLFSTFQMRGYLIKE